MASSKSKPRTEAAEVANTLNKKAKVIALLRRDGGATLTEITEATGWLPHSARAVLTGLRKKGFMIEKSRTQDVTRWSITAEPAA